MTDSFASVWDETAMGFLVAAFQLEIRTRSQRTIPPQPSLKPLHYVSRYRHRTHRMYDLLAVVDRAMISKGGQDTLV